MSDAHRVYYVYLWFRPSGAPCYVGKGKKDRWLDFSRPYNRRLARIIAAAGGELPAVILREGLSEKEAHATEILFIAAIGRGKNGPLVNMTDGGEGFSGGSHTAQTRSRMSAMQRGIPKSPEHRAALVGSGAGKYPRDSSWSAQRTAAMKGRSPWNKGKKTGRVPWNKGLVGCKTGAKWTEDRRRRASERLRGIAPEAAISAVKGKPSKRRGRPLSAAHRAAISASRIGRPHPHKGAPRLAETRPKPSNAKRPALPRAA
jgi:hypothetical protein